jgi:hypothetical protein
MKLESKSPLPHGSCFMSVSVATVRLDGGSDKRYIDELLLLLSATIRLLRVLTLNLDVLALKATQRRDVGPNAYPARDLIFGVRDKLWLEIVYDLWRIMSDPNRLYWHTH